MDADFPAGMTEAIAEFLASDSMRLPGADLYPDAFSHPMLFPLQRKAEMRKMIQTARRDVKQPRVVYEIGSDKSLGFWHWLKCFPTVEKAIACEIRGCPYRTAFEKAFPHVNFLWLEESSYTERAANTVRAFLGADPLDVLFIDGDKGRFYEDFRLYEPMMRRGGVALMHDITDAAPGAAFQRVVKEGRFSTQEIIDRSEVAPALDREKQGIPPANPHEGWLRHWKGASAGVGVIHLR